MAYREQLGPRRRHRPDRLPPLRPQRDRRARLHAAEDGGADQGAPAGLRDLRRAAGQARAWSAPRTSPPTPTSGSSELQGIAQGPAGEDGGGRVRGPELDRARHRRARPHEEPRGRDRGLGEAPAVAERGAAAGPRQLHDPPQAAQAAARADREARRRARSSSATPRRSRSPRCSPRAPTSGSPARTPSAARSRTATSRCTTRTPACKYVPIQNLSGALAPFELHNSPLSEAACLGFEYGYSAASPESPDPLGGAVRRLRQLGAGDHRQLHRRRRVEVGPDDPAHAAAPARLRGRRARALERPDRALHPARLRGQHPARQPDHRGPVLPPAAPPGADREAAAAGRLHAEGPAAPAAAASSARGADRGRLPVRARRPARRGPPGARSSGWCSAAARSTTTSTATSAARRPTRSRSPGSSCSTRSRATSSPSLIASYPNLKKVVWAQEEPKNMGAWSVMARRLPELLPEGVELQLRRPPAALEPERGLPGRPPPRAGAHRPHRPRGLGEQARAADDRGGVVPRRNPGRLRDAGPGAAVVAAGSAVVVALEAHQAARLARHRARVVEGSAGLGRGDLGSSSSIFTRARPRSHGPGSNPRDPGACTLGR